MNAEEHLSQGIDLSAIEGDQRDTLDALRSNAPLVRSSHHGWMVLGHAETRRILEDHQTFSNEVSRHLSIPNGMDPPAHTLYRQLIEPFFAPDAMTAFEPRCHELVEELVSSLSKGKDIEVMSAIGTELAVRVQTAFMGWPEHLHIRLRDWTHANHGATRSGDRAEGARVADEFAGEIRGILEARRRDPDIRDDPTTALLDARVEGRPLTDEEMTSIVRNWTMGEVGTISTSVGIVVGFLAANLEVQDRLRAEPRGLTAAIDEMLRIDGPLVMNRRVATCPVRLGDYEIAEGDGLSILWPSANRDEGVFGDPDDFRPQDNADHNLLYGAGIHMCPGAPLARMQLDFFVTELLKRTTRIEPGSIPAERASFPAGGYASLVVRLH
ncbi:MAG: cytochrome P450 [Acidimicrobiia bacterium]